MQDSLMNPRLPAFRPMFERPATTAPVAQQSLTGIASLKAMAQGFISDALQDSSIGKDPVPAHNGTTESNTPESIQEYQLCQVQPLIN